MGSFWSHRHRQFERRGAGMLKVHISPVFHHKDAADGGIRRVTDAELKYLPQFDIEVTSDPKAADVVQIHATAMVETDAPIVGSCHGLYWTAEQEWPLWAWHANKEVTEVLRRSTIATAPSEWVAQSIRRGMLIDPVVINHGIDVDDWQPEENHGYVLWNKARVDTVCNPEPVNRLAAMAPNVRFVSTFGQRTPNVELTGAVPYEAMKAIVKHANVYLATARETFGIGTLEVLAAGVPVLGWATGGQLDIIQHKRTGYLAELGNYPDLLEGLQYCLDNRDWLSKNARQDMAERFTWPAAVAKYAEVMKRAASPHAGPKVSVIVTCYNLVQYLTECVDSIKAQSTKDWEIVLVDDCSPDETPQIAKALAVEDERIRYHRNEKNVYLAEARNVGIGLAKGKYIIPLDADDMLHPRALETLSGVLDKERGLSIAYGAFELIEPDGRHWVSEWPQQFNYHALMARKNQNPYCSMFRREVWERTGGYRRRNKTAEDADFWVRAASYGFRSAKVTDAVTLIYRNRADSMSHQYDGQAAMERICKWSPWSDRKELTPYGSIGEPINGRRSWPVNSFEKPVVSVIIPVGPGHGKYLQDALDSLLAQTVQQWEAIIVNDSGEDLTPWLAGFPFVRVLRTTGKGGKGPGRARNIGVSAAKGQFLVCLDADDALLPTYLENCLAANPQAKEYVYTDHLSAREGQPLDKGESKDFDCKRLLQEALHSVTTLVPIEGLRECPFDEKLVGWEDWEVYIRLAANGWCGIRIPEPLLVYRLDAGGRRETSLANKDKLLADIRGRYSEYIEGGKEMGCSACGKRRAAATAAVASPSTIPGGVNNGWGPLVLINYATPNIAKNLFRGYITRQPYGKRGGGDSFYVYLLDQQAQPNLLKLVQ